MIHAEMPPRAGRVYQLTESTVSPARVVTRDRNGFEREESVCALAKHAQFVDRAGNICTVPLQTARVLGHMPCDEHYERAMIRDQIRGGGLPLAECPYTQEYRRLTGTPTLVEVAPGEEACDGEPGGCKHLKPIIEERRRLAREVIAQQQAQANHLTQQQAADMARAMAEAFGAAVGTGMIDTRALAKQRMKAGRGEDGVVEGGGDR